MDLIFLDKIGIFFNNSFLFTCLRFFLSIFVYGG